MTNKRRHQALRPVGQPHRPAANVNEGWTDRPFPPQTAEPHQQYYQSAGLQHNGGDDPALQRALDGLDSGRGRFCHCRRSRGRSCPEPAVSLPEFSQIPLPVLPQDARRRQVRQPLLTHPGGGQGRPQRQPAFLPLPLRQQGPQVREGLLLPGKLIGRQLPTLCRRRRSYPNLLPPLLYSTGICHSYVHFPNKKPNFPSRF
jgi:hypothetical protein